MDTDQRLNRALLQLLHNQRTATLGTLDADGEVSLSRVPYAVDCRNACLIIHISALAAHTAHLQCHPRASLLIGAAEVADAPVHALPRLAIQVLAVPNVEAALLQHAKACYLHRFPEAEPMTQLGDFRFVGLRAVSARHVAGYGAARSLDCPALARLLSEAA